MNIFKKAEREQAKLRLCIGGASGSGKTVSALNIANGLGGRIAVIDTEHGSASLYSHLCDFDVLELKPPYSPESFIAAIKAAERAGYDVLIIDSISHEWNGSGGCLELNDEIAQGKYRGNTWSAWNETTKRHRAFLDAMLQSRMHVIATTRSKTETAQQESITGKKSIVKLGMKAEQRDGIEYEFTVALDLTHDGHFAIASKDRTGLFAGKDPQVITVETGAMLVEWLNTGKPQTDWFIEISKCQSIEELKSAWESIPYDLKAEFEETKNEQKNLILTNENENEGVENVN